MREKISEYTDSHGIIIREYREDTDNGAGWYHTIYEAYDGVENLIHTEYRLDNRPNKNFGYHCACGRSHATKKLLDGCMQGHSAVAKSGSSTVFHGSGTTTVFSQGGGGGTAKCEVIPYRERDPESGYLRTPISPYDHSKEARTPLFKTPPSPLTFSDGRIPFSLYPAPILISAGCAVCDDLMVRTFTDQVMFDRWYHHYIHANRRGEDDFIVSHLDFIMTHMMQCVTPDTVLPPLPGKIEEAEIARISRVRNLWEMTKVFCMFYSAVYWLIILICHVASITVIGKATAFGMGVSMALPMTYALRTMKRNSKNRELAGKSGKSQ